MNFKQLILENDFLRYAKRIILRENVTSDKIVRAIDNSHYVGIYYDEAGNSEIKSGFRLIEPFCYGTGYVDSQSKVVSHEGDGYLRAYVIFDTEKDNIAKIKFKKRRGARRKSASRTKKPMGWRLFRLDRIKDWQEFNRTFTPGRRGLYNPNDKNIYKIISRI